MKLFYKVYLFLILVLLLILAAAGLISYHREVSLFHHDMEKDAILVGEAISGLIEHDLQKSGKELALKHIREMNSRKKSIRIRWVDLDPSAVEPYRPSVPYGNLLDVSQGKTVSRIKEVNGNEPFRLTYIPINTNTSSHSALEISESLAVLHKYIRNSLLHLLAIAVVFLLASGALLWFQFQKWIHRPLVRFIDKSRRIGQGDLDPDLIITGRDEFAELGKTFNLMCTKLQESLKAVQKENERRLEAMEQLRHAERLATLGRLSAGMAHEFGTPLNVITGRSSLIRSGELDPNEVKKSARIIEEQAKKITGIMQSLLDFARRRKPDRSFQDIEAVLQGVIAMLEPTAGRSKVVFEVVKHGDLPLIFIDPLQMQQVFTNLLLNGIQAMTDGGRLEIGLVVRSKQHPEKKDTLQDVLCVDIRDEGKGIPPEQIPHIFEPFFSTKEVGKGTGLGLSIVYGIIQEHGGWIEVESTPGTGTCFRVSVPVEMSK